MQLSISFSSIGQEAILNKLKEFLHNIVSSFNSYRASQRVCLKKSGSDLIRTSLISEASIEPPWSLSNTLKIHPSFSSGPVSLHIIGMSNIHLRNSLCFIGFWPVSRYSDHVLNKVYKTIAVGVYHVKYGLQASKYAGKTEPTFEFYKRQEIELRWANWETCRLISNLKSKWAMKRIIQRLVGGLSV